MAQINWTNIAAPTLPSGNTSNALGQVTNALNSLAAQRLKKQELRNQEAYKEATLANRERTLSQVDRARQDAIDKEQRGFTRAQENQKSANTILNNSMKRIMSSSIQKALMKNKEFRDASPEKQKSVYDQYIKSLNGKSIRKANNAASELRAALYARGDMTDAQIDTRVKTLLSRHFPTPSKDQLDLMVKALPTGTSGSRSAKGDVNKVVSEVEARLGEIDDGLLHNTRHLFSSFADKGQVTSLAAYLIANGVSTEGASTAIAQIMNNNTGAITPGYRWNDGEAGAENKILSLAQTIDANNGVNGGSRNARSPQYLSTLKSISDATVPHGVPDASIVSGILGLVKPDIAPMPQATSGIPLPDVKPIELPLTASNDVHPATVKEAVAQKAYNDSNRPSYITGDGRSFASKIEPAYDAGVTQDQFNRIAKTQDQRDTIAKFFARQEALKVPPNESLLDRMRRQATNNEVAAGKEPFSLNDTLQKTYDHFSGN